MRKGKRAQEMMLERQEGSRRPQAELEFTVTEKQLERQVLEGEMKEPSSPFSDAAPALVVQGTRPLRASLGCSLGATHKQRLRASVGRETGLVG